jgi:cellulose synthase/poly-beta-1,6-N-acetylglucosamine synthase-like glycosyltransferase
VSPVPGTAATPDRPERPDGVSVVIPTLGRDSLGALLQVLSAAVGPDRAGPPPGRRDLRFEVVLVDDRRTGPPLPVPASLAPITRVVAGRGAGPAAARNRGWWAARYGWVAFLDDDVLPDPDWLACLAADLAVPADVGGVQGRVRVPLPDGRRPTDWERTTAGLTSGQWITADMAYRRTALARVGGFDERFPRAYREDAELAHRVIAAGWRLVTGERGVTHPVRPQRTWVSLRAQRGNADDAFLRRLYGRRWRQRLGVPAGRRPVHAAITVAGVAALGSAAAAVLSRRLGGSAAAGAGARAVALACGLGWAFGTGQFASARIRAGPRGRDEVVEMLVTSVAIPPLATGWWWHGWWRRRRARPWGPPPGGR